MQRRKIGPEASAGQIGDGIRGLFAQSQVYVLYIFGYRIMTHTGMVEI
jgi:hypothetical protein